MPSETGATHSLSTTDGDPLQADLYFSSVAGFGEWRILCSRAFLSDVTRDSVLSKAVLGRLRYVPVTFWSGVPRKITRAFTGSSR